jgi:hypothetical protein
MIDFNNRNLFTPVTHPPSGVTIHVLTRKVAPVQQGFYFVNDSMSADGRYLWFYCAFPPSGNSECGRTLGVVDFLTGEVRHFPETQFGAVSPYVDVATGDVYWQYDRHVWKRGPQQDAPVERVNSVPDALIGARRVLRSATHLTRSADGREFLIDLGLELQWHFGSLPLDGGDFQLWHRFDRFHNHAQFSPTDPDVVLFAEEGHADPITGLLFGITNRLWWIKRGQAPRPIMPEPLWVQHEWWDADGDHIWCVRGPETWRVRVADGEVVEKIAFPCDCWHAHASRSGRLIVIDSCREYHRGTATTVHLLNRDSGRLITVVENPERTDYAGRHYHIDPHPRFCCGDRYVVFTTTVRGEIDVAMVPTAALIRQTS